METSGLTYHKATSYDRRDMTGHYLDWEHQPQIYKEYPGIDPLPLPPDIHLPETKLSSIIKHPGAGSMFNTVDLKALSTIFRLTYSLTARARHAGGDIYYRSVASAGALYPAEIYVAAADVAPLEDGLYHFSIARHGLSLLRSGRFSLLGQSETSGLDTTYPVLTFLITAIFFRSAWKYRERSYRYHLLDAGHLIENLILALKALGLPYVLDLDFDDDAMNRLLGVDSEREVCLALCRTTRTTPSDSGSIGRINDLDGAILRASRVSDREIPYPAVKEIHWAGASVVQNPKPETPMISLVGPSPREWSPLKGIEPWPERIPYAEAVMSRRSRRNFVQQPMSRACLDALLEGVCQDPPGDPKTGPLSGSFAALGLLVGRANGWVPGYYVLDPESRRYGLIDPEWFMDRMARICLDQMWIAHAAVHVVFLSNLGALDRTWGPRGYRYAMMTAGRLGERIYLMAAAMGLGCCGIGAFYDAEAADLLKLNPESRLLYVVAVGPTR